jgi:NAD-dependent deacetylase
MNRSSATVEQQIDAAARRIQAAGSILFITGAGISADSGLPTYRGISGLYENRNTEDGYSIEEALSSSVFRSRPEITWKYMAQVERGAHGKTFNAAHAAIAEIERRWPRVWTLTQNIDGFHTAAGSRNVIEIHGTMYRIRCEHCGAQQEIRDYRQLPTIPPPCSGCHQDMRPDVVLFGEMLPTEAVSVLQRELQIGFDLVVSVGTSSIFPYIMAPVMEARRQGIPTIEINPSKTTEISRWVDIHVQAGAAAAFQGIMPLLDNYH